jgi:hypothetical protein
MSQHPRHRIAPPMRAHRPTQRGRHRVADRPRGGLGYMRTAVATVLVTFIAAVHLPAFAFTRSRSPRS